MDARNRIIPFPYGRRSRQHTPPWQCKPRSWNVRFLVVADRDSGAEAEGVLYMHVRPDNTWELSVHVQSHPELPDLALIGDEHSVTPQVLREIFTHLFRTA